MGAKFYCLKSNITLDQVPHFGPFYPRSSPATAVDDNSIAALSSPNTAWAQKMLVGAGRYAKFPGVYSPPQPSRGYFNVGTFAAITNHATFTLDDGVNPPAVFEFVKSGVVTPGNIEINIAGMTTAAEVAAETADEINDYTTTLADPEGGWAAFVKTGNTSQILLVQSGVGLANLSNAQRAGWALTTYGQLGNVAIIVGAGSALTSVVGMQGGTLGAPGVPAQFVVPGHRWALTEASYIALPKAGA